MSIFSGGWAPGVPQGGPGGRLDLDDDADLPAHPLAPRDRDDGPRVDNSALATGLSVLLDPAGAPAAPDAMFSRSNDIAPPAPGPRGDRRNGRPAAPAPEPAMRRTHLERDPDASGGMIRGVPTPSAPAPTPPPPRAERGPGGPATPPPRVPPPVPPRAPAPERPPATGPWEDQIPMALRRAPDQFPAGAAPGTAGHIGSPGPDADRAGLWGASAGSRGPGRRGASDGDGLDDRTRPRRGGPPPVSGPGPQSPPERPGAWAPAAGGPSAAGRWGTPGGPVGVPEPDPGPAWGTAPAEPVSAGMWQPSQHDGAYDAPPRGMRPAERLSSRGATTSAASITANPSAQPAPPETGVERVFAPPNVDGPRVILALAWIAALLPAAILGVYGIVVLFGGVAAFAAWGTAHAWRKYGYDVDHRVAAGLTVVICLASTLDLTIGGTPVNLAGPLLMGLPAVALVVAAAVGPHVGRAPVLGNAGALLRSVVPPCTAVVGAVFVARSDVWSLIVFVLLVSAFDAGSFLVGAESTSPVPGIVAGVACTLIAGVPAVVSQFPPFDGRIEGIVFAGLVGVVAPLGQIVASLALPRASEWVGPLRRLDAYIVTAPLFAWVLAHYLETFTAV